MFTAKEAREKAIKNRVAINQKNFISDQKEVLIKINKAVSEGRFLTTYRSSSAEELILLSNWLKELGYIVPEIEHSGLWPQAWTMVIKWGGEKE